MQPIANRARAAGLFDGDGGTSPLVYGGRVYGARAYLGQTGRDGIPEVLERFLLAVGEGKIHARRDGQPRFGWYTTTTDQTVLVIQALWPWLSQPKREQFLAIADRIDVKSPELNAIPSAEGATAWAAGFFDAEGCTTINSRDLKNGRRWFIAMQLNQSGSGVCLERLQQALGLGRITGPHPIPNRQSLFRWSIYGLAKTDAALGAMWPWLGAVKRSQAERCLQIMRAQPVFVRPRVVRPRARKRPPKARTRYASRKPKPVCVRGHDYSDAYIYFKKGKYGPLRCRQCRPCNRERDRLARARKAPLSDARAGNMKKRNA